MSDASPLSLPDAARHLGVPVRALRDAIRTGRLPSPPHFSATAPIPAAWLASAAAALEAAPGALRMPHRQKVPPFARYRGTSAWRKYHRRVREYARFRTPPG